MKNTTKTNIFSLLTIVILIFVIVFFTKVISTSPCCICGVQTNTCCPCSNTELINIVENHTDQRASSASSWLSMCEEYKEETNDTRECFE